MQSSPSEAVRARLPRTSHRTRAIATVPPVEVACGAGDVADLVAGGVETGRPAPTSPSAPQVAQHPRWMPQVADASHGLLAEEASLRRVDQRLEARPRRGAPYVSKSAPMRGSPGTDAPRLDRVVTGLHEPPPGQGARPARRVRYEQRRAPGRAPTAGNRPAPRTRPAGERGSSTRQTRRARRRTRARRVEQRLDRVIGLVRILEQPEAVAVADDVDVGPDPTGGRRGAAIGAPARARAMPRRS